MTSPPPTAGALPDDPADRTLPQLLAHNAHTHPGLPGLSWQSEDPDAEWTTLTWGEIHEHTRTLAMRLPGPRRRPRRPCAAADGQPARALAVGPGAGPPRRGPGQRLRHRRPRADHPHRPQLPRPPRRRGRGGAPPGVGAAAGRRRHPAGTAGGGRRGGGGDARAVRVAATGPGAGGVRQGTRHRPARGPADRRLHLRHHRRAQGRRPHPPGGAVQRARPGRRGGTPAARRAHLLPAVRAHRRTHAGHLPALSPRLARLSVRRPDEGRRGGAQGTSRAVLRRAAHLGEAVRRRAGRALADAGRPTGRHRQRVRGGPHACRTPRARRDPAARARGALHPGPQGGAAAHAGGRMVWTG